jgi:hypothetical protein
MAQRLRSAVSKALGRERPAEVTGADEPCLRCGESTVAGSIFYSDRLAVPGKDGHQAFLCGLCNSQVRSEGRGRQLTEEEVRSMVENGSIAAIAWSGTGPAGSA